MCTILKDKTTYHYLPTYQVSQKVLDRSLAKTLKISRKAKKIRADLTSILNTNFIKLILHKVEIFIQTSHPKLVGTSCMYDK